jgi:hypothetical protein
MQLDHFTALLTREGQWALESAMAFDPREKEFLGDFQMLAKRFPRELARAALTTAILRGEGRDKFPQAEKMYFTRQALEQATPWEISSYRARRFEAFGQILDLGCSIGGDAMALAQAAPVIGIDHNPVRLAMARQNVLAVGGGAVFIQADIQNLPLKLAALSGGGTALFFDPARRIDHQRVYSVDDYQPPLSTIAGWLEQIPEIAVKISPGVQLEELEDYDCEIEFISLNGQLKEACLWFGEMKTASKRATLLTEGQVHTLTAETQPELPLREPSAYLYEPDPSVLRAGLVQALGRQLDAAQLDPEIAYLTADRLQETPFARVWQVEDWMPFQLKKLRAYLRERGVGSLTVKKRGSPIVPEELIQQLRLEGEEEKTLFLTMLEGKPVVIIAGQEATSHPTKL